MCNVIFTRDITGLKPKMSENESYTTVETVLLDFFRKWESWLKKYPQDQESNIISISLE